MVCWYQRERERVGVCGCGCGCGCGCVHRVCGRFAMIVNGERRALIDVQVLRQGMSGIYSGVDGQSVE